MIRIFKTGLPSSSDSPEVLTAELGQQTSPGRRGFDPKSSGHRSPGGGASILLNKRLTLPFLAFVAVLAAGLLFLMPGGLLQAQDSTTVEYIENSEDAVLSLSVSDPEGATPVTWSLVTADVDPDGSGPLTAADTLDNDDFKISQSGVLEFRSPPDFDAPGDSDTNNTYNVVVQASDGDAGNNAYTGTDVTSPTDDPGVNMVDNDDTRSWFKVIVNVQDVNEPGSIRMRPTDHDGATLLQPQIGVGITAAALMDEDGTPAPGISTDNGEVATYKWQRSSGPNGPWTDIRNQDGTLETDATYTPEQAVEGDDLGKYLQVVATYTEAGTGGRGGQTARAKSMYPTIRVVGDNNAPSFAEGAVVRPVRENSAAGTNIGQPVVATNPESVSPHNEKLTYWLSEADAGDVSTALGNITQTLTPAPVAAQIATTAETVGDLFSIDPATGQLTTKTRLNYERDPDSDDTIDPYYAVTVNVADSSEDDTTTPRRNTASITVIIRILQTNDEPTISGDSTIEHVEGGTALDTDLGTDDTQVAMYDATDTDPTDTTLTFSLSGADKDLFRLRNTTAAEETDNEIPAGTTRKVLEFRDKPDYEDPADANTDNVYEVTVEVFDGEATATRDVTVKVTNMQEDGEVEVTPAQARIGIELTAELTDSDIVVYGPMWRWQRSLGAADTTPTPTVCANKDADNNDWMNIPGSGSAMFTPRDIDLGYCLRAVATYNDGYHEYLAATDPASTPGASGLYTVTDTRFDKTANKTLSSVQHPTEPNIAPKFGSAMTKRFVLENAAVNNPVGKPVTARDGNGPDDALAYTLSGDAAALGIHPVTGQLLTKMEFNHESKDKYAVTVTATDTHQATASIRVDVYVVDVDEEAPVMMSGLRISSGPSSKDYAEGGMDAVGTYTADGPMAGMAAWSVEGYDADQFGLDTTSGASVMLKFMESPDYEMPMDADMDNTYMVTIKATDGTNMAMRTVAVTVTNENERGMVELSSMTPVVGVALTATLTDPDSPDGISADQIIWQWFKSKDMTFMDRTEIETTARATSAQAMSSFTPVAADDGYYLKVMATYTDNVDNGNEAMATTTGMVTTVPDQMGTVRLSSMNPVVGTELTATLTDPDGSVTGERWMWYKSMDSTFMDGTEMEIGDATSAYTPMAEDEGYHLMVKVMYTDGHGAGKEAMATTTGMVTTVPDQMGTLRLSSMNPVVGTELTATLTDPDGSVTGETWMWYKSMDSTFMDGTEMEIGDATSMGYTPMAEDEDYYLMVKVMYTDGHGAGKEAMATAANAVTAGDPLVIRYDTNPSNGMIDKAEVIAAINDYLFGTGADAISKADVIRLINLYLFG